MLSSDDEGREVKDGAVSWTLSRDVVVAVRLDNERRLDGDAGVKS